MLNIKEYIKDILIDREMKQKIDFFSKVNIFNGLSRFAVGKLVTAMYSRKYEAAEIICPEQELGKALFIIMSGEVAITRQSGTRREDKIISRLKSGDFFGEMALLEEKPRSATATALTDGELYIIYKANFDSMIEKDPKIGLMVIKNIAVILSARLRGMINEGK
ncbi:MAG: cyclic nucleotide-binding domain-containing protein [Elusimicrobia bacterium]|nr:cyclic nucleotide-binding domain-containing protein [Elusimicrobiota bacterium]